ncbi:MAG TPA: S8 family serine peptidase [Gaiellaceae bacterium]|nr:S8 family serine peptidase [Gaiellaceae bacterium]
MRAAVAIAVVLAAACAGLARASVALAPWELRATRTTAVPADVLRDAAAVTIGIVDTGADVTTPELAARNPATWNTRTGTTDVRDANGHGTFVASLAAESSGDAQLLIVKSGGNGGSFTDIDEAAGIVYAVDHGARILNLSIGGPKTSSTERGAIRYAVDHGALVVTAAGNEYGLGNPVEYPAALLQPVGSNGVGGSGLVVTASDAGGRRAAYANTGSWVSLAAPGDHVLGAVSQLSSALAYPRVDGVHGYASGTSFAAPQVAGAAALVWAANPSLTAAQVAQILKETASGGGRWTPQLGYGVVDVAAAVQRAQQGRVGVLLGGLRLKDRARLTWSGDAPAYTLTVSTDGRAARTLLASTTATSTSVPLAPGHTYSFTVTALDAGGAPTASSTVVLR